LKDKLLFLGIKTLSVWFMTLVIFERANITLGKFMIMNSQGVTTAHFSNVKTPIFIVPHKKWFRNYAIFM